MISQLLAIARNAFVESVRQPVLVLLVLVSGLLQVFNTWNTGFSMGQEETSQLSGDDKLLFDVGLGTIFLIGTLLAGFIATAVMSREIENKTVLTVISKPVGRTTLVLGKFLGVAGAISAAVVVMLTFLLFAIRHGVLSTAADEIDGPVVLFSVGGVAFALLLAGWCNFFYGWNFPQTTFTLLVPVSVLGYLGVLMVSKEWHFQPITATFKGQVVVASLALGMAILVLTAVATAASTRLAQVPTILTCLGVFIASLLSNHLIGRHVHHNEFVGVVLTAAATDHTKGGFNTPGEEFAVLFDGPLRRPLEPREPFYYSPSPNGFPMIPQGDYTPYAGSLNELNELIGPGAKSAIIVTDATGQMCKIRNIGEAPIPVSRPPENGDYVFTRPTEINYVAMAVWGAIPNMQFFWLLDAVSQNRPVPGRYLVTAAAYGGCQIVAFLALAVLLFQRRDVG